MAAKPPIITATLFIHNVTVAGYSSERRAGRTGFTSNLTAPLAVSTDMIRITAAFAADMSAILAPNDSLFRPILRPLLEGYCF